MYGVGNTYGGDGQTTFALPDLRGRIPVGVSESNPWGDLGETFGQSTTALTTDQLPAHTHTVNNNLSLNDSLAITVTEKGSQDEGTENSPAGNYFAQASGVARYIGSEAPTNDGGASSIDLTKNDITLSGAPNVENTGTGATFSNFMPGLGMNYIICALGNIPTR